MPLPDPIKAKIERIMRPYCENKAPEAYRDQLRVGFKFRGNSVTLYEERPRFREPETWVDIVVAQFRYDPHSEQWTLYCADRNSRWHRFDYIEPNKSFKRLLDVVDEDPTGIFWG